MLIEIHAVFIVSMLLLLLLLLRGKHLPEVSTSYLDIGSFPE